MIYFASISRVTDGLALTANSDSPPMDQHDGLEDAYRKLKLLTRISAKFPDRCTLPVRKYSIHFITALDLSLFVLCDATYPSVLAFSFLSDLQREFLQFYDKKKVMAAVRPYALIEFDWPLQKLKHRYNNPRTLSTKVNLPDLSDELRLRPPYVLCEEELQPNFKQSCDDSAYRSTPAGMYQKYLPIPLHGMVSLSLCCFCALLNLSRGVHVINETHSHIDATFDADHYQSGATFIVCCVLSFYQVYLLCYPLKRRKSLAFATLGSIFMCQLYIREHRSGIGLVFHVVCACYATFVIVRRQIQAKLPQYTL